MKDAFGNEFKESASTTNPAIRSATLSAHSAIDAAAARARPAVDKAATAAHDAAVKTADWVSEKTDQAMSSEKELIGKAMKYVDSNPLKALGMALVAGAVIARIL
jgi:ElaB/YqjD/DUF883 family membrane-anchored ribosome-binding protein